jgi:hypothetical protein
MFYKFIHLCVCFVSVDDCLCLCKVKCEFVVNIFWGKKLKCFLFMFLFLFWVIRLMYNFKSGVVQKCNARFFYHDYK